MNQESEDSEQYQEWYQWNLVGTFSDFCVSSTWSKQPCFLWHYVDSIN